MSVVVIDDRKLCKGKTKSGQPCKNYPVVGREYCSMHQSPAGVGHMHPQFKGKERSRYLPERMLDSVVEGQADPDLTGMRYELLLCQARVDDLTSRADNGESGEAWKRLSETQREINRLESIGGKDNDSQVAFLRREMAKIIEGGLADHEVWREVQEWVDLKRKISESERRRMVILEMFTPNERVLTLLQVVLGIVREELHNHPDILRRISARVGKIINMPTGSVAPQHGPK